MIGFQGIIMGILIVIVMGGLIFNALSTGTTCAVSGGKNCNGIVKTLGGSVAAADAKIYDSVATLKEYQTKTDLTDADKTYMGFLRNNIFFGILNLVLFIWVLNKILGFVFRSQEFSTGGMVLRLAVIILILAIGQIAYTTVFENRFIVPFSGIISFVSSPGVLADIVDTTNVLPGDYSINDIASAANITIAPNQTVSPSPTPSQSSGY